jgi:transposase-like protein
MRRGDVKVGMKLEASGSRTWYPATVTGITAARNATGFTDGATLVHVDISYPRITVKDCIRTLDELRPLQETES